VSRYHSLPIAQKRAEALARVREPAVTCPDCDMQVMPVDLHVHLESRCPGRREPGPSARWVDGRDALVRLVPKATLHYWVAQGFVRVRGARMDREYLLRDLALKVSQWRGFRRR
jgi:hypothetical protein